MYLVLIAAVYVFQRSLVYFPSHRDSPPRGADGFVPWIETGEEFIGYVRAGARPRRVVVVFHGNGGEAIDRAWFGGLLPDADTAVVLAEHPGYGAKGGESTEEALVRAGRRVVALSRARWSVPLAVVGESLGTGVACAVAGEPGVERVGLISPFNALADLAAERFWFLPVRIMMKDSFESFAYLNGLNVPLHIVHGTVDNVVPIASGQALFENYGGKAKEFTKVPGAAHNDMAVQLLRNPAGAGFLRFIRGG